MSLQRKENNLRRAQARFDRVSRRTKQFQIDFRREANSRDRFRTRPQGLLLKGNSLLMSRLPILSRLVTDFVTRLLARLRKLFR